MRKTTIIMASVALMAASGGYFVAMILAPGSQQTTQLSAINARALAEGQVEDIVGLPRPDFTLTDAHGEPVSISEHDGDVVLINFWATWCTPCIEEMPMLSQLQARYLDQGFRILGIAVDDPQKATEFAAELGIDYPVLVGTADTVLVGRQYGNRAGMLPYSVLIDQQGIVQWSHLGALEIDELERQIKARL